MLMLSLQDPEEEVKNIPEEETKIFHGHVHARNHVLIYIHILNHLKSVHCHCRCHSEPNETVLKPLEETICLSE